MRCISKDIRRAYDPATGFHGYPPNRGRISVAEVLRRAGGVDKNTLKEERYAKLRGLVDKFVARQAAKLAAHHRSEERAVARTCLSNSALVDSYAQKFKAAEYRAEVAEQKAASAEERAAELERGCQSLRIELAEARGEITELVSQLSSGRIVKFKSR
jgi:chromosome segregation ATPase